MELNTTTLFIGMGISALVGAIITPSVYRRKGRSAFTGVWMGTLAGVVGSLLGLILLWIIVPSRDQRPDDDIEPSQHLQGAFILAVLITLGGLYLWQNSRPAMTVSVPNPPTATAGTPTPDWYFTIQEELTPVAANPTDEAAPFAPPTIPTVAHTTPTLIAPAQIEVTPWPTPTPPPADSPAGGGPTPYPSPTGFTSARMAQTLDYEPPPVDVPLSLHVNDHYWFKRPVDVSANSASIFYYAFGSNGMRDDMRVHHGVDMPNEIGVPIHAGYAGEVIYAGLASDAIGNDIDIYPSYGNLVIVKHNDSYRGQEIWTLYAHMSAITVAEGQHVAAGDVLGLIGGTGDVSGPHVHMEVRMGKNSYWHTYNPLLWIVPQTGTGVVAGQVRFPNGEYVNDVVVTLINENGGIAETTTTYVDPFTPGSKSWHVRPDPAWQENFAMADIPAGEYTITTTFNGQRYEKTITVRAGTTNFVVLGADIAATPQPVAADDTP